MPLRTDPKLAGAADSIRAKFIVDLWEGLLSFRVGPKARCARPGLATVWLEHDAEQSSPRLRKHHAASGTLSRPAFAETPASSSRVRRRSCSRAGARRPARP